LTLELGGEDGNWSTDESDAPYWDVEAECDGRDSGALRLNSVVDVPGGAAAAAADDDDDDDDSAAANADCSDLTCDGVITATPPQQRGSNNYLIL
jgi:hypothetical protein